MNEYKGIIYFSKALLPFHNQDLRELMDESPQTNRLVGVTGFLFTRNAYFVQYLEGEQETVNNLMNKIRADRRHEVLFHNTRKMTERSFAEWGMLYIEEDLTMEHLLFVYLKRISTLPGLLNGRQSDDIWKMADQIIHKHLKAS